MNPGQLMKVTYHLDTKKINKYIKFTSVYQQMLERILENCPYEQDGGVRLFWIDDENDEIDINDEESLFTYETFTSGVERRHLHIAKVKTDNDTAKAAEKIEKPCKMPTVNQAEMPPAAGSYEFAVHDNVECDACLMAPIIGFRYKCIQCPNFDLCQNCESKHVHSEHMMVRMPTNNCPSVVETYITGRTSGRKHGKRSKDSCPFVKNGLSVVIDDDAEGSQAAGGEGSEQATASNGKERHHGRRHHHRRHPRHNFLHNLYEMMHDLAEGGGAAAAAHAMGEEEEEPATSSTKTTTTTTGPHTTTSQSTCNDKNFEENIAQVAAQQAHEAAVKAAEIAAKVAHETAVQAAKNIAISMSATPSAPTAEPNSTDNNNKNFKEKVDATTSPRMNNTSVPSSPSLETLTQFLDPQYMKTGIQILNNFSDMFAKMLDPLDNEPGSSSANKARSPSSSFSCPFNANGSRKNSTASAKSTVSSQQNSINSENNSEQEKPIEKQQTKAVNEEQENKQLNKQTESEVSSNVEIEDLGSDSENDSVSESFIKLEAPKEANINKSNSSTASTSAQTTPPQSLNKSNVMDFAQLSADLKAHIAEEEAKGTDAATATGTSAATAEFIAAEQAKPITTANTTEQVVSTTTSSARNQERRAIPVYHADERINDAVLAMMAMGFSNEGAWLTQLLETVNGNIAEALELMPVDTRGVGR